VRLINSPIAQAILADRKFAYLITDPNLCVVQVWGDAEIFPECSSSSLGSSLLELVPELIGSEDLLVEILLGQISRSELNLVIRPSTDNELHYLSLLDLPYRAPTGEIQGIIHLVEDVTEMGKVHQQLSQRRNELQLLQDQLTRKNLELAAANAELREMNELKTTFVSIATHELRNPLTSIVGFLEMVQTGEAGPLTPTQVAYLNIIAQNVERLNLLSKGLANVIRIEAGRIEMILKPVDLLALVHEVVENFSAQIAAKFQQLTVSAMPDLPLLLCDRIWMNQILGNLVGNAIKYTGAQGIIEIQLSTNPHRDTLQIAVRDNGMGIAKTDQPKLFTRFYRTEQARKQGQDGIGLGLYIVRALVELHGGEIWLESKPNVGSTFYIKLPAVI
jgi:signal transduction histidine kinase